MIYAISQEEKQGDASNFKHKIDSHVFVRMTQENLLLLMPEYHETFPVPGQMKEDHRLNKTGDVENDDL